MVTVHVGQTWAERTAGMMGWTASAELAEYFATDPELDFPPPPEAPEDAARADTWHPGRVQVPLWSGSWPSAKLAGDEEPSPRRHRMPEAVKTEHLHIVRLEGVSGC
jgi:hypothetical protein